MAPGSLHSFHGFPGGAPLHLHLPHVLDPQAAACCYVEALELAGFTRRAWHHWHSRQCHHLISTVAT